MPELVALFELVLSYLVSCACGGRIGCHRIKLHSDNCHDAAAVLKAVPFSSGQIEALQIMAPFIRDVAVNMQEVVSVFSFSSDQSRAREILASSYSVAVPQVRRRFGDG